MENNFYVYEWYNTETNEVFYVGKGKGDRYKNTSKRNQYFLEYIKNNPVNVRKIQENLTEDEAFALEEKITADYKKIGQCQCSLARGGSGGCSSIWTDEMRQYWSEHNPMKEEAQRERMRQFNPMYNSEIAQKNGEKHKRAVIIDGIRYEGLIDAAKALNVCDFTISTWCKRGYNTAGKPCRYADEPQKEYIIPKRGRAVIIDDIYYYETVKEAALSLGAKDSSPLVKAIKSNKPYKGHICKYADQQPSYTNSNKSSIEGSTTNE